MQETLLQNDSPLKRNGALLFSSLSSNIVLPDMTALTTTQMMSCFLASWGLSYYICKPGGGGDNGTYLKGLDEK